MRFSSIFLGAGLAQLGLAAYTLQDDYSGNNFANMFDFNTFDDPTHGYVNFVDQNTAQSSGMFSVNNGVVTMGVDHANVASGRGRNSIRVTSKAGYTHGLVVLDLAHMPGSICGAWPAFWMTGPNWPNSGEIDIIEGVNAGTQNRMTMHTSGGCTLADSDCQGNEGCGITGGGSSSYGNGFNSANGGIYAMEWKSSQISVWYFSRGSEPGDINSGNPNPSNWGNPTGTFASSSGCDIDSHFMNNNIVFDTTFCGDWAGNVWSQDSTCSALASTCQDYVQNHPGAFQDAYWAINYLKVYTDIGVVSTIASVDASSAKSSASIAQPTSSPVASSSIALSSATPSPTSVANSTLASLPVVVPTSAAPFPSGNASSIAFPTASGGTVSSGAPMPSANSSHPFNATNLRPSPAFVSESSPTGDASPSPTIVLPAESSGVVPSKTTLGGTEAVQLPTHSAHHHMHPPGFGPKNKRVSRVARHLQNHAHGAHGHT